MARRDLNQARRVRQTCVQGTGCATLGCLLSLGIDPRRKRFLMLKSRVHYRAGFRDVAKEVIECAGTGVCTSDYDMLDFQRVRRPIYPLDLINEPGAGV